MSSNLLKRGFANVQQDETRVIDTNGLIAKRIEALAAKMGEPGNEGFVSGISADNMKIDALLADEEDGNGIQSNVIKAGEDAESLRARAKSEAEAILADARKQAEQIKAEAAASAEREKNQVLSQAKSQGYEEGKKQAEKEAERMRHDYSEKERQLEAVYQKQIDELEPQFIDTITGIYEHIFHVELSSYREILVYLISSAMRKAEGSKSFFIHVSKEDYPYVSMQKKQIAAGMASSNGSVEIVEDMSLGKNECLIETDGGIFDCGLGTQLTELNQKLRLLSYEK